MIFFGRQGVLKFFSFFSYIVFSLFGSITVSASGYAVLESIPGIAKDSSPGLYTYLKAVFLTGIGLAGVLAVLMIVIGGIQYIGSGMSPSGKEDAKDRITSAILGLLLALGAYLILNTINPNLVNFSS